MRRLAGRFLFPAIEAVWATAWWIMGRLIRPGRWARSWQAQPGQRVVVLAPHPDDETGGAGGAIALHLRAGNPVTVVVVTDGGASQAGNLVREVMVKQRRAEVTAAVQALGSPALVQLGLPENSWDLEMASGLLAPLVNDADIVYAPSSVDYHPEHVRVARVLSGLVKPAQIVRAYELGVPLTPLLVNVVADIGAVAAMKERALAAFGSQAEALQALRRQMRYRDMLYGRRAVEAFWELPAEAYARVIHSSSWPGHPGPFRGIRRRPLADPLAALIGVSVRGKLRRIAGR